MSQFLVGYDEDGKPIYSEEPPKPTKLKRTVVRCLGRIEQIFACAERAVDRSELLGGPPSQGAAKNA